MKNGEQFDGDDLDMIWPEEKPLPPPLYRDFGPAHGDRAASLREKYGADYQSSQNSTML